MRRKIAAALTALGLMASICATTVIPAEAAEPRSMNILVMGDSYSAGNGAGGYDPPKGCYRSDHNYGEQFGKMLTPDATVTTVACSGATTFDFSQPQRLGLPAQLDAVNETQDLIFLTIGGNDADPEGIVKFCMILATRDAKKCGPRLDAAEALLDSFTFENRVRDVLKSIRFKNKRARIVLLGYPHLEGVRTPAYVIPGPSRLNPARGSIQVGNRVRALVNHADEIDARLVNDDLDSNTVYVSTKARFKGHELFAGNVLTPGRWFVAPLDSKIKNIWYHPNPTGWAQIADLLFSRSDVPKVIEPPTPVPDELAIKSLSVQTSGTVATWTMHAVAPRPLTQLGVSWRCYVPGTETLTLTGGSIGFERISGTNTDGVYRNSFDFLLPINNSPTSPIRGSHCLTTSAWVSHAQDGDNTADFTKSYGDESDRPLPIPGNEFNIPW